jgi:hypothetical protein
MGGCINGYRFSRIVASLGLALYLAQTHSLTVTPTQGILSLPTTASAAADGAYLCLGRRQIMS